MKYLLLIPACLAMLLAVICLGFAIRFKWSARWMAVAWLAAGFVFQIGGIWIAGAIR